MNDTKLQKKIPAPIREKGQYLLAFGVIVSMLVVANIPVFVIFFFGVFAYLVARMFASGNRSETREIFEFYLAANDILREDERRWYGFEIRETIDRGEAVIKRMKVVPPLVNFALGALQNKIGDHKAAVNYLSDVIEKEVQGEQTIVYPTPELRNYVKVLRKIEREPADAPITSAAVRSLERMRRLRGKRILEESRTCFSNGALPPADKDFSRMDLPFDETRRGSGESFEDLFDEERKNDHGTAVRDHDASDRIKRRADRPAADDFSNRKPISEVLHDIYDKNIQ